MKVWKYQLAGPHTLARMPQGSTFLKAGIQDGNIIVVWALVDEEEPMAQQRSIHAINTGDDVPHHHKYLDTVTIDGFEGPVVWHIFEDIR